MTQRLTPADLAALRQVLGEALDKWNAGRPMVVEPPAPVAAGIPAAYAWLRKVQGLPLTIEKGLEELGQKETAGAANSPVIMGWAKETGLQADYTADAVPWCGLFAAVVVNRAGKGDDIPDQPLWALNWGKFGVDAGQPGLGDILTFTREGGGHVGFYVGEDAEAFHVLGGNQSDAVSITRIAKTRLNKARRPKYRNQPAGVRPYLLAAAGGLSHNEA